MYAALADESEGRGLRSDDGASTGCGAERELIDLESRTRGSFRLLRPPDSRPRHRHRPVICDTKSQMISLFSCSCLFLRLVDARGDPDSHSRLSLFPGYFRGRMAPATRRSYERLQLLATFLSITGIQDTLCVRRDTLLSHSSSFPITSASFHQPHVSLFASSHRVKRRMIREQIRQ